MVLKMIVNDIQEIFFNIVLLFLFSAVGFMFLFSFFFMIFCVVWFIAGIHMHIVCRDSKDAQPIDVFLASELSNSKVDISQSLKNCRENQPLYTAINGENIYNISAEFDVEKVKFPWKNSHFNFFCSEVY